MNNLPIDSDGDEMGLLVDRWLHTKRLAGATPRQMMILAKNLAAGANGVPGDEETWWEFLQFARTHYERI